MQKLITFLGKRPQKMTYLYRGKTFDGHVFAEALRQFVVFDQMLVFTTTEAETTSWPVLEALADPRIYRVHIPTGENEAQLWALFDKLTEEVKASDTVIFDITHGLRSIPFLVFLAAAYLKEARGVTIDAIYYGAFELGDEKEGKPAPVIDLSGFVSLLDWVTATNRFIETGDGAPLASLLRSAQQPHPPHVLQPAEERAMAANNQSLRQAAGDIEEVSRSLLSNLVPHAQHKSHVLVKRLEGMEAALRDRLPPYRVLAERIRQSYAPLAHSAPFADDLLEDLRAQLHMMEWYIQRNRIPQAITLMREWMITAVAYRLRMPAGQVLDYSVRQPIEQLLNQKGEQVDSHLRCSFETLDGIASACSFWQGLVDWRNFVDHAGHRPHWDHKPSRTVVDKVRQLHRRLAEEIVPQFMPELEGGAC